MRPAKNILFFTIVTLLLVQSNSAFSMCEIFKTCPTSTTPAAGTPATALPLPSSAPTQVPVSSSPSPSASPTPTSSSMISSSIIPTSSSILPSSTMLSSSIISSSSIPSITTTFSSTTAPSLTPSASASSAADSSSTGTSNIGVIVGSVCGFVAIIGAGFAYAFFSKTRRRAERNQRLYSENGDDHNNHGNNSYQPDPFATSRPSPAIAASAVAAADHIHSQQKPYNYGNMAPQPPMVALKTNDPYYNNGYSNEYSHDAGAYYQPQQQQQYYDPNAGYYDHAYMDSQKQQQQQYDAYNIPQHHSPNLTHSTTPVATATTGSNVYQTPHAYPDEHQPHSPHSYK